MNFRDIFTALCHKSRIGMVSRQGLLLVLWLIVIGGLMGLSSSIQLPDTLKRLEMVLLDFRLKLRADQLTPSDNIIVAAMDRRTRDEARNQPELGITGRVLPRRKVAQIIDFFSQRGAK